MAILFSGDFHAGAREELSLITKDSLISKFGRELFDEIKYHIILGDGGFLWPNNEKNDAYNYRTLGLRPFPILCVIGNHEPMLGRKDLQEIDLGLGNTVYQINDKPLTAYLKRGEIYNIDGFKFLVLGGALSIDKAFRTPNRSWWKEEYWTEQEKEDLLSLLKQDNEFDYVLSHTGPGVINMRVFKGFLGSHTDKLVDEVALFNNTIDSMITCKQWFCGHWHEDRYYYNKEIKRGYQYLYNTAAILKADEIIIR
jgi:hypothetical protein